MKREVAIPEPALRFPEAGWRERVAAYAQRAASEGLDLVVQLEAGASEAALTAAQGATGALRELLAGTNGGRIGHVHLLAANALAGTPVRFASDYVGVYAFEPGTTHEVSLAARDSADEHRFSTLGAFLESALIRAWAEAAHRKAEADAGDDLDDGPWVRAARALELRIDPRMIRTRED